MKKYITYWLEPIAGNIGVTSRAEIFVVSAIAVGTLIYWIVS